MNMVKGQASIERLARAVLESALPGRVSTGRGRSDGSRCQRPFRRSSQGGFGETRASDLTGLAAGRGPWAPCLAVLAAQWRIHQRTVEVGTLLRS
jgi:hypothetical protein